MRSRTPVRRWLLIAAGVAALAIAGTSAWLAFAHGGGGGGAAAPAAAASQAGTPVGGATSAGTPTVTASPRISPAASGASAASGSPATATQGGAAAAGAPGPATLLPLPAGVGHFTRAPLRRLVGGPRNRPVPILMYHLLGSPPPGEPYPDLFVSLHDFAAEMRYLERHGYTAVTLHQLTAFWHGRGRLPAKPVVLSFDDGYRSDWRVAAPVLQRLGWPGVLNLCLNAVRPHGDLPARLVRRLVGAGWEIDDHTLTHPDLTTLDAAGLHREIFVSRAILERLTGQHVSFFCYPSGAYDATVVRAVRAAGFAGATTTDDGLATRARMYTLPRIRVHRDVTLSDFAQALGA